MSRVRSKNTKPELIVRSLLHRMGFRFRVNRSDLPGKPDIVLSKYKTVVFVHGCFWHRHKGCKRATAPSTRREFWEKKFTANVERDKRNCHELQAQGWKVVVLWECEVSSDPAGVAERLAQELRNRSIEYPLPERHAILKVAEEKVRYQLAHSK